MSTLVDSNVLIDILADVERWREWSAAKLAEMADFGEVVINQIVYAETSMWFREPREAAPVTVMAALKREGIPWEAAHEAGRAHLEYRRAGGMRERTLPDFLIGAHALVRGHRVLTRDGRRYRQYFPTIEVIAPETHP